MILRARIETAPSPVQYAREGILSLGWWVNDSDR
jgi:hypothetical protein